MAKRENMENPWHARWVAGQPGKLWVPLRLDLHCACRAASATEVLLLQEMATPSLGPAPDLYLCKRAHYCRVSSELLNRKQMSNNSPVLGITES